MKIIIVFVLLGVLLPGINIHAQNKWTFITVREGRDSVFVMRKKDMGHGIYKIWEKAEFPDTIRNKQKRAHSKKKYVSLSEYDCVRGMSRNLTATFYYFDGTIDTDDEILPWRDVVPGTVGDDIMSYVCEGKLPESVPQDSMRN